MVGGVTLFYPETPTLTEEYIKIITENSPKTTEVIKELINQHNPQDMLDGIKYYESENDILLRKQYYYDMNKKKVVDDTKTNNRIPHNFHKILVDQKVGYLTGNPVAMKSKNEAFTKELNQIFSEEFDDVLPELVKGASNKGREWLQPFINEDGDFDYMIIPAEQVIALYNPRDKRKLDLIIRYYFLADGKTKKIEVWDDQEVTYYEEIDGIVYLDVTVEENPASHFYFNETGYGWGKVPFVEFANNDERISDLKTYKRIIDAYDLTVSDTQNNIEDIQSLITVLKGYDGENLQEFMDNLRYFKSIKVDAEGGVDSLKQETPIATVTAQLDRFEENIFLFGQGVNPNKENQGGDKTGVALKFLYALLDLKSDVLERKFKRSLRQLMWFACSYLKLTNKGSFDYKDVTFTFNRSMIFNEAEQIEMFTNSAELSMETRLAHHPWVEDVQQEIKRIDSDQEKEIEIPYNNSKIDSNKNNGGKKDE
ncbi:phage portal protein [Bacillus sp. AFS002410]|nr:phage portal protein [Bacillus sp. AFS002410]